MVVTCPKCGGVYSVRRVWKPQLIDSIQQWDRGQKRGVPDPDYDDFSCSDCGERFSAEGMTRLETNRYAKN